MESVSMNGIQGMGDLFRCRGARGDRGTSGQVAVMYMRYSVSVLGIYRFRTRPTELNTISRAFYNYKNSTDEAKQVVPLLCTCAITPSQLQGANSDQPRFQLLEIANSP
jgi:hypothetical protein